MVEVDEFGCLVEEVDLLDTGDEVAEADTDEAEEHAALVCAAEEFFGDGDEDVVEGGVGDALLDGVGVEVGVAYFDGDAGGEFLFFPEGEGDFFDHVDEEVIDGVDVGGVVVEGGFGAD